MQSSTKVAASREKKMSLLSHDSFWNAIISLPTTKKMLQLSLKKCGACNRTILEAALDNYVGKTDGKCKCGGVYSQIIGFWIDFLRRSLSIKREKVEKLLADPYAQRAIITIVRSFNHFGIKKPLSIYAPFLSGMGLHTQMQPKLQTLLLKLGRGTRGGTYHRRSAESG